MAGYTQLGIESNPGILLEVILLDHVAVNVLICLLFLEKIDMLLDSYATGCNSDAISRISWIDIYAREMLGTSYFHLGVLHKLVNLDIVDITVTVCLVG